MLNEIVLNAQGPGLDLNIRLSTDGGFRFASRWGTRGSTCQGYVG
jgi:hypothetical protein